MTRIKWMVPVLAFTLITAACDDTNGPEDIEPNVATMRLIVGGQTVNVNTSNGTVTGGPILLAVNTNVPVVVTFLRADGTAAPLVTDLVFRMDATPANANVTFSRTGPFAGTLRGTVGGTTAVEFALYHGGKGHNEFEYNVPVTVQ